MQYSALYGFKAVFHGGYGSFEDNVRGIIEEPGFILAAYA
jgi:hypothetical protein